MKTSKEMEKEYAMVDRIVPKWGTPEQLSKLRGLFKHEDEIWPESYVQLWIPNDFNYYAICMGYKGHDENGNYVLVAGFRNPFGPDVGVNLPGNEYKYWCELPSLTEEMKKLKEQITQNGTSLLYEYPNK
jgi:hypothetical protein